MIVDPLQPALVAALRRFAYRPRGALLKVHDRWTRDVDDWDHVEAIDLGDAATLGFLMGVLRAVTGDQLCRTEGFPDGWRVVSPALTRIVGLGPTEGRALGHALVQWPRPVELPTVWG